jgi:hypothetical protein
MAPRTKPSVRIANRGRAGTAARLPGGLVGGGGPVANKIVDVIRQNPILLRMERHWNAASQRQRQTMLKQHVALRRLDYAARVRAFVELGLKHGTLRGEADVRHATKDWLGGYFKGPVIDIIIEGFIFAMKRSIQSRLPVAMYWVAGAESDLKVAVAQSEQQITFLLVTPRQPAKDTPVRKLGKKDPLWVVSGTRRGVKVEQVVMTALKDG